MSQSGGHIARVLHVVLIWSCKYSCLLSLSITGDVLQERCLHFGLNYTSVNVHVICSRCKFVWVPGTSGFAANFGPCKAQICTLYFSAILPKKAIRVLNQSELLTRLWTDHNQYRFFPPKKQMPLTESILMMGNNERQLNLFTG